MKKSIDLFKVFMSPKAASEVAAVLNSGFIGEGQKVKDYENDLAKFFSKSFYDYDVITCNSATSAEHMLYHLLKSPRSLTMKSHNAISVIDWKGLNENSEVITTPLTCTATNWPIIHNGLKLVWADIDPNTMNISLDSIYEKINEHTRIVQVVHWGGYPVDLDKLQAIVSKAEQYYGNQILIIEDCAHAFGSEYKGMKVGTIGHFSTFSTQAIKHLTTIDGGFLISPYEEFSKASRLVRWYGIDRSGPRTDFRCEADIPEIGFKFHMNDVNATVGLANLKYINQIIAQHQDNGKYYNEHLNNIPGLTLLENLPDRKSSYWLYTLKVEDRDGFMKAMNEKGISVSRVHERNDKHSAVKKFKSDLPNLDIVSNQMICIPVGWWVTPEDRNYIVDTIKQGW